MLFHSFGRGKFSLFHQNLSNIVNEWKEGKNNIYILLQWYIFFNLSKFLNINV